MRLIYSAISGLIALGSALSADAQDYSSICIKEKNGSEYYFPVEGFQLTYAAGMFTAGSSLSGNSGAQTFALSDLELMRFSTDGASVNTVASSIKEDIQVFTTAGVFVDSFASQEEAREKLPSALYIVKSSQGAKVISL